MKRKHTLSEKLPLLSMLLSVAAAVLVCTLAGSIRAFDFIQYLLIGAAGVLCLLAQKWWFAPAFKGIFRAEIEAVWQKKWLDSALPVETGSANQGKH